MYKNTGHRLHSVNSSNNNSNNNNIIIVIVIIIVRVSEKEIMKKNTN